ncbi:hypothetical protein Celaphus_00003936 [Cervus elaphus hippelaphus]|uniref:Uncharacterized protein n=1 Tax=Cervus elaphus hippelaphus TaxID=46360 RepID=A0A212DE78_CEREH|nr:hypothetical protein Celaphus_00003936 [Cervus elaphus hippelaphus]
MDVMLENYSNLLSVGKDSFRPGSWCGQSGHCALLGRVWLNPLSEARSRWPRDSGLSGPGLHVTVFRLHRARALVSWRRKLVVLSAVRGTRLGPCALCPSSRLGAGDHLLRRSALLLLQRAATLCPGHSLNRAMCDTFD